MTKCFDIEVLRAFEKAEEIVIRTRRHPDVPVPIWVGREGDEVFVRSARGSKGRWYTDLATDPLASIEIAGTTIEVRAVPAIDSGSLERATRAYTEKYRSSPYLQGVVRDEVLATTLRLEPR